MEQLTIHDLQNYLTIRYKDWATSSGLFMKLVEEIGEVAEALNQIEGRKAMADDNSLEKELADVIHYVLAIASINNIDLTKTIIEKDKVASLKYNHTLNLEQYLKDIKVKK